MLKAKDKEKILKAQKQLITYKGTPIRVTTDFSPEAMEVGRSTFSKCSKKKTCQPGFPYLVKLSFVDEGEIKTFPNEQKLREFVACGPYKKY